MCKEICFVFPLHSRVCCYPLPSYLSSKRMLLSPTLLSLSVFHVLSFVIFFSSSFEYLFSFLTHHASFPLCISLFSSSLLTILLSYFSVSFFSFFFLFSLFTVETFTLLFLLLFLLLSFSCFLFVLLF